MKKPLVVVATVLVTIGILFSAWKFKLLPIASLLASSSTPTAQTQQATVMYTLPADVVNLAGSQGYHYLKIQVALEYVDPQYKDGQLQGSALTQRQADFAKLIDPYTPAINDTLITVLTQKTAAELLTSQGKTALREQILKGLQAKVPGETLKGVYFTQFVIQ